MKKTVLTFFLFFSGIFFILAQKADFRFYTVADGLPSNSTRSVTQDAQGYIWVNSGRQLCRFDGAQFLSPSSSNHPIFSPNRGPIPGLMADGSLLYFIQNKDIISIHTQTGEEKVISIHNRLPSDLEFDHHDYWLQFKEGAVAAVFNEEKAQKLYGFHLKSGAIRGEFELNGVHAFNDYHTIFCGDSLSNMYCISHDIKDVLQFDQNGKKIRTFKIPPNDYDFIRFFQLRSGNYNRLLLSINNKIFKLHKGEFQPHPINAHSNLQTSGLIKEMEETKEGNLWVVTQNNNLLYYDVFQDQLYEFQEDIQQLLQNRWNVMGLFVDASGTLWIPSDLGLLKVMPQPKLFDTYFTEQNEQCGGICSFRGFTEDDSGNVYASFYNNIFKIPNSGTPNLKPILPRPSGPFDLGFYKDNLLLNNGLIFDLNNQQFIEQKLEHISEIDNGVFAKDQKGRIWWAYYNLLFKLEEKANGQPVWQPAGNIPNQIMVSDLSFDTHNNQLWYGAADNLWTIDPITNTQKRYGENETELLASLQCIYPDGQGGLWLGSEKGLLYFNYESQSWKRFTQTKGLSNDIVAGILPEGDSCLWLSTYQGLSRFHIPSGQFLNFYKQDGLADNEFNRASFFKASDGRFFFGGIKGVTAFYPQEVVNEYTNLYKGEKLLLRSVSMTEDGSDKLVTYLFNDPQSGLEAYHHNRTLNIEFGLFGSNKDVQTLYSHILDGHDANWSLPNKNNSVMYSSLPAGDYVFRVKALNSRGGWLSQEITLPLTIHPPWWETRWAYFSYTLILAGIGYSIFSFLKRRWELQSQLQLEHQEALRLKELDSFKSRLFTNLTHEFRTPLTVLLGMTEELSASSRQMVINKIEKQKLENGLGIIERNGKNLLRLVNQLLDLSKMENKTFQLQLQQNDIVPYLRYLTESFHSYANGRNLSLRFFTTLEKLEMDFDPEQVQQIMTNLLSNAIKFTPSGGEIKVQLAVSSWQSTVHKTQQISDEHLLLTVKDTGIGISAAELPHIFDRFYQVDGSTTRAGEGTGIGLAHTLELVKLMGGTIKAESELNKETTFTVKLPISNTAESSNQQIPNKRPLVLDSIGLEIALPFSKEKENESSKEVATSAKPQLLIIEDNADVVAYLKTILSKNYEILIAYNGRIGIEMALEKIPDLIISDVMMPEKDGYQVCNSLKNDERTSHIPIVLLTAKADTTSKITGLKRGADAYISKPFNKAELLATLEMMIENKQRMGIYFSKKYNLSKLEKANETNTDQLVSQKLTKSEDLKIEDAFLQKVRQVLEENYTDENFALPLLCQKVSMSRYQLFRKMKALINESPSNFIRNFRLQKARHLLQTTNHSVKEVGFMVGYKDIPHFSRNYQETFGIPPSATSK